MFDIFRSRLVYVNVNELIVLISTTHIPPHLPGLYAVSIGPIAYAIMGSSPQLVTGPTNVLSMLTLSTMPTTWGGAPIPQVNC